MLLCEQGGGSQQDWREVAVAASSNATGCRASGANPCIAVSSAAISRVLLARGTIIRDRKHISASDLLFPSPSLTGVFVSLRCVVGVVFAMDGMVDWLSAMSLLFIVYLVSCFRLLVCTGLSAPGKTVA